MRNLLFLIILLTLLGCGGPTEKHSIEKPRNEDRLSLEQFMMDTIIDTLTKHIQYQQKKYRQLEFNFKDILTRIQKSPSPSRQHIINVITSNSDPGKIENEIRNLRIIYPEVNEKYLSDSNKIALLNNEAIEAINNGDYQTAVKVLSDARKIDPNNEIVKGNYKLVTTTDQTIKKIYIKGLIDYRKYDTMKMDTPYIFSITISKNISQQTIKTVIKSFFNKNVHRDSIRISNEMTARLVSFDPGLEIDPKSSEKQNVEMTDSTYTRWDWSVIAKQDGIHTLKLYVSIIENGTTKDYTIYEGDIFVFVKNKFWKSIVKFIKDNIGWLWTAVILPFLPILWKKLKEIWKNRKKRKPKVR